MLKSSRRRYVKAGLIISLLAIIAPSLLLASIWESPAQTSPVGQVQMAWQLHLPSSKIVQFSSYRLLEGHIYAMATDGTVISVRADNGQVAWMRRLADEGDQLWPPESYHSSKEHAIGFTRLHDVVLVDPKNGVPIRTVDVAKPNAGPGSFAPGHVYLASAGGRLSSYRLKDQYAAWRAGFDATISLPPVFVPSAKIVAVADDSGLVAGLNNEDKAEKRVVFRHHLHSRPRGWLAVDDSALYLSTDSQILHAIDMGPEDEGKKQGEIIWQYRLAKAPEGGPTVTKAAIYQATIDGGLHRIPKTPGEFKAWYAPNARRLLAEWPEGVVVLTVDEKLALIRENPADAVILADVRGFSAGIINVWNHAIFLTSPEGTIRCLKPADAPPLSLASFITPIKIESNPEVEDPETFRERLHREIAERKSGRKASTNGSAGPAPQAPSETIAIAPPPPAVSTPPPPPDRLRSNIPVVK